MRNTATQINALRRLIGTGLVAVMFMLVYWYIATWIEWLFFVDHTHPEAYGDNAKFDWATYSGLCLGVVMWWVSFPMRRKLKLVSGDQP
jgi:hypothetical protein